MKTPDFRKNTWDEDIFRCIVTFNEYKIPGKLNNIKIIDIGGHIGSFSWLCAKNGAKDIIYCEADKDNFEIAQKWIDENYWLKKDTSTTFGIFNLAVWKEDNNTELTFKKCSNAINTGGGSVMTNDTVGEFKVNTMPFDDIIKIRLYKNEKKEKVLLKLDCEGSEFPILFSSKNLSNIDYICGEFHELYEFIPDIAKVDGFDNYDVFTLQQFLKDQGFTYTYFTRSKDEKGQITNLGHFWASRTNDNFFVDLNLTELIQENI